MGSIADEDDPAVIVLVGDSLMDPIDGAVLGADVLSGASADDVVKDLFSLLIRQNVFVIQLFIHGNEHPP